MSTARNNENSSSVIGRAGGGLDNATWAANAGVAKAGQQGELKTAAVIDGLAHRGGPVVLHDLMIPMAGITANIDHAIVAGDTILLIDSKAWRPGFFWTVGGRTRRGLKRFPSADKQTMRMAHEAIQRYLPTKGVDSFRIRPSLVVIWPTNRDRLRIGLLKMPGARVMSASTFARRIGRLAGADCADPRIVDALSDLVTGFTRRPGDARTPDADTIAEPSPPAPLPVFHQVGADPYAASSYTTGESSPLVIQPARSAQPPPIVYGDW